jgi:hypothetical protein
VAAKDVQAPAGTAVPMDGDPRRCNDRTGMISTLIEKPDVQRCDPSRALGMQVTIDSPIAKVHCNT